MSDSDSNGEEVGQVKSRKEIWREIKDGMINKKMREDKERREYVEYHKTPMCHWSTFCSLFVALPILLFHIWFTFYYDQFGELTWDTYSSLAIVCVFLYAFPFICALEVQTKTEF